MCVARPIYSICAVRSEGKNFSGEAAAGNWKWKSSSLEMSESTLSLWIWQSTIISQEIRHESGEILGFDFEVFFQAEYQFFHYEPLPAGLSGNSPHPSHWKTWSVTSSSHLIARKGSFYTWENSFLSWKI